MDDSTVYRTVAGPGASDFEIAGSRFLGRVRPVETVEAAEAFVASVREAYADATHNVPAYRVREGTGAAGVLVRERQDDDGEPTGSSGKPALTVLQRRDLENVAVVVTRYYGGTNLGVGGLARAYGRATKEAVDDAGVVEERPKERFAVTVAYDDSGTVRGILESSDVDFEATYEADVGFAVVAPIGVARTLRDRIRSATSGRAEIARDGANGASRDGGT